MAAKNIHQSAATQRLTALYCCLLFPVLAIAITLSYHSASAAAAAAVWAPVHDIPYEEIVSHRFTYTGAPSVGQWRTAPFANVTQIVALPASLTQRQEQEQEQGQQEPQPQPELQQKKVLHGDEIEAKATTEPVALVLATEGIFSLEYAGEGNFSFSRVTLIGIPATMITSATSRMAIVMSNGLASIFTLYLAYPQGVTMARCSHTQGRRRRRQQQQQQQQDQQQIKCEHTASFPGALGARVHAVTAGPDGILFIASEAGIFHLAATTTMSTASTAGAHSYQAAVLRPVTLPKGGAALSVAYSPVLGLLAVGSDQVVAVYTMEDARSTPTLSRWEWVTRLSDEAGGAYDGPALDIAFDHVDGTLFVATPTCVNLRHPNGSISRLGWQEGSPLNGSTVVTVSAPGSSSSTLSPIVYIGSQWGAASYVRGRGGAATWQLFAGPRYLPGIPSASSDNPAGLSAITSAAAPRPGLAVLAGPSGVAVLEAQKWTLARKAAHYEATLVARHNRWNRGLVGDCSLPGFGGALAQCHQHDDDNNGLWTSLVVGALALKHNLTRAPANDSLAEHFYNGMILLNNVTGIPGLMARSAVRPGEAHGSDGTWHPVNAARVPEYAGWTWKGDTSSDEVTGHVFAHTLMAALLDSDVAKRILSTTVLRLVRNKFDLIDVTGLPTLWGRWGPDTLNNNRKYSDGRGVNSLQILAYLRATLRFAGDDADGTLAQAYAELTNSSNQYAENMLNLKIESPGDDNYSDDELTFLPFLTACFAFDFAREDGAPFRAALHRTWHAVRGLRSDLWNAIYLACGGAEASQDDVDAIAWNLRTWPLELTDWPTSAAHRNDVCLAPRPDRFGRAGGDSRRIWPAHQRSQTRWNSNPHDLEGGSGGSETDPGAWLLPYWLARYTGAIREP